MTASSAQLGATVLPEKSGEDYVVKGGWYTLWVMLALTLFSFVDRQVLTLAAAPMAASLGLNDSELGLVQGLAFAIFSVVAVYPIAWAADRFDRRIVLGLCVVIWSVGTAACGLARNFDQLFLAAVAIAAGEAGLAPIALAFVPDLFKGRKRLLANGLTYCFAFLGIAAGLALGGSAIGALDAVHADLPPSLRAFESWRLAFFLVALPAPLFLGLMAFARLGRPAKAAVAIVTDAPQAHMLPFVRNHAKAMLSILGALGFYMLAFGSYLVWLPVASTRLFATTPTENGTAMGLATAIGMSGGVTASTLAVRRMFVSRGRTASVRFAWIAMLCFSPFLFAFPFIAAPWQGFALFGLLMLVGTGIGSLIPTMLQDMAPTYLRARMLAINTVITGLVGGIAPTCVGWASTALGTEPRMLVVAMTIVALPSWIIAILLFRTGEKPFARLVSDVAERETLL